MCVGREEALEFGGTTTPSSTIPMGDVLKPRAGGGERSVVSILSCTISCNVNLLPQGKGGLGIKEGLFGGLPWDQKERKVRISQNKGDKIRR